jgi:hypothetical protein
VKKQIYLLILLFSSVIIYGQTLIPNSTGSFLFTPQAPLNRPPVEVFYHIPSGDITTMPIIFSFHGANRDGNNYRDYWISMANANGFMVFAPEFSDANYPGGDSYQLANIFDDGDNPSLGTFNSQNEWSFSIIDPLFDYIKSDISGVQEKYNAWGHSGGAQFLHRFVEYLPNSKLDFAVCSNAGWYTVPEFSVNFPYGLQESQLSNPTLVDAFSKKLIIHLGLDDTDPDSAGLRHNTIVDNQQGLNRLVRGQYFFNTSQSTANNMTTPFNWEKYEVSGIGHNAQLMANDALPYVLMNSLSILKNEKTITLNVFPNPTSLGYVNLKSKNGSAFDVSVYDVLGKQVIKSSVTNGKLDVSSLNTGLYIMKVSQDEAITTQKLVIK